MQPDTRLSLQKDLLDIESKLVYVRQQLLIYPHLHSPGQLYIFRQQRTRLLKKQKSLNEKWQKLK